MPFKTENSEGVEVEVYTAEELKSAVKVKEEEFGKTKTQIEKERDDARKALGERTTEFGHFRKLNEEQLKKLDEKDLIIYNNGLKLKEAEDKRTADEKKAREASIEGAIRSKVGTDEKLFGKAKDMYNLIGVEANTPAEMEKKVMMVLGAIGSTEPDLVASVQGFGGGSYQPPVTKKEGESFADTERGKAAAKDFGLTLEIPKK